MPVNLGGGSNARTLENVVEGFFDCTLGSVGEGDSPRAPLEESYPQGRLSIPRYRSLLQVLLALGCSCFADLPPHPSTSCL